MDAVPAQHTLSCCWKTQLHQPDDYVSSKSASTELGVVAMVLEGILFDESGIPKIVEATCQERTTSKCIT